MISVILPTYNPDIKRLQHVLRGLTKQNLAIDQWELIIIDNNSTTDFQHQTDLRWHPQGKIVSEAEQGLTFARLKGISEAKYDIIVMVDDDNILNTNYLQETLNIFSKYSNLGAIGGKITPLFEGTETQLASAFENLLALRNMGAEVQIESFNGKYPAFAPVGAGMAFRKTAIASYVAKIISGKNQISDRKGTSLSSSGDNEMVWEIFKSGWNTGYFPELHLQHIIPASRTTKAYLARLNYQIQESWGLFLLKHGLCPWKTISPFSLPFRKIKTWLTLAAWRNEINYIKWRGTCGTFNALAHFKNIETT